MPLLFLYLPRKVSDSSGLDSAWPGMSISRAGSCNAGARHPQDTAAAVPASRDPALAWAGGARGLATRKTDGGAGGSPARPRASDLSPSAEVDHLVHLAGRVEINRPVAVVVGRAVPEILDLESVGPAVPLEVVGHAVGAAVEVVVA